MYFDGIQQKYQPDISTFYLINSGVRNCIISISTFFSDQVLDMDCYDDCDDDDNDESYQPGQCQQESDDSDGSGSSEEESDTRVEIKILKMRKFLQVQYGLRSS